MTSPEPCVTLAEAEARLRSAWAHLGEHLLAAVRFRRLAALLGRRALEEGFKAEELRASALERGACPPAS